MKPLNPADYPTYNIGDRVTIRQWDDMESEFGLTEWGSIAAPESFTLNMKKYCGKTFIICAKHLGGEYGFSIYRFLDDIHNYTAPMFEQSKFPVLASAISFDSLLQGGDLPL